MEATFDFTYFYLTTAFCLLIGLFSAIYKKPIDKIMAKTENQACGRSAH